MNDQPTTKERNNMKRILKTRSAVLLASGTVIGAVVAGGVAYATIPSNNVIDACYLRSSGAVRIIDSSASKCKSGESSIAWNVQGVQGAKGDKGDRGDAGPSGTSVLYATSDRNHVDLTQDYSRVVGMTLPAGKYLVSATINVGPFGDGPVDCLLGTEDYTLETGGHTGPGDGTLALSFALYDLSDGGDFDGGWVGVRCKSPAGLPSTSVWADVTAAKVDTVVQKGFLNP